MIKRIIFDIDNTLLDTTKDCLDTYKEYFGHTDINITAQEFYDLIEEYHGNYDKDDISNFIKEKLGHDFTKDDFLSILSLYSNHATILNPNINNILDYLSKKYDLVCLTAWYTKIQESRLQTANLLRFFNKVYGFENAGIKPSKDSFIKACENYDMDECLVIGDSINSDIIVPHDLGIKTILLNSSNIETDYDNIKSLDELVGRL